MQLQLPAQLPAGLPANPRPLLLVDVDAVSHGLAEGQERTRATNATVGAALETAQTAARSFNADHYQVLWAASTATARCHLDLITRSANNLWAIRRGLDGADKALLEELNDLVDARTAATRKWHAHGRPHADIVILVGQDHAYAPAIASLRLLGIPTWILQPGRYIAADLYRAAMHVTPLTRALAA